MTPCRAVEMERYPEENNKCRSTIRLSEDIKASYLSSFSSHLPASKPIRKRFAMSSSSSSAESRTRHYSQQLAAYTLRQFNLALASLDTQKAAGLSKIPSAHLRVSRISQNPVSSEICFHLH